MRKNCKYFIFSPIFFVKFDSKNIWVINMIVNNLPSILLEEGFFKIIKKEKFME